MTVSKVLAEALSFLPQGYLFGLGMSTIGSSGNLTIAPGIACDSTGVRMMKLQTAVMKNTTAWVAGGAGSLDTGTIAASTWYHFFLIENIATGAVDIICSATATPAAGPTVMPSGYTVFRRIGSMKMLSNGAWWASFVQDGDDFFWPVPVQDVPSTNLTTTSALFALSVPPGVSVIANLRCFLANSGVSMSAIVQSPLESTQVVGVPTSNYSLATSGAGVSSVAHMALKTNTSAQIRAVSSVTTGTTFYVVTSGWTDMRGKLN